MLRRLLALSLLLQALTASAIEPCPGASGAAPWDQSLLNDTARVLAGLDAPLESSLAASIDPAELARHRGTLGKSWAELRARQLDAVSAFGARLFGKGESAPQHVFYPFSGPDALYLVSLFPDARASVLTGLEPVGTVPVLADLSAQEIESSLAELRKSLYAILSFSFFRTNDLTVDLKRNRFVGVTPILFTFMAQAGYAIFDVRYVLLTPDGSLCQADAAQVARPPAAQIPGVEIEYFAPGHADFRKLTYFAADIGDGGLRKTPQYLDFIHAFAPDATYLKSASYLMHKSYFSLIRKLILDESELVLQDDSGVPHGWFRPQLWTAQLYGRYQGPIGLFRTWYQADLAEAFEAGDPEPLDFGIGYQHRKNQSNLVLYRKRVGAGESANNPLPMKRRALLSKAGMALLAGGLPAFGKAASDDPLLSQVLSTAGPSIRRVLAARSTYEPQILWTRLRHMDDGRFEVRSEHRLGVERKRWFTAASFVKLPLAALVFEALEQRGLASRIDELHLTVAGSCGALPAPVPTGWKLGDLIRSMLVASDNLAYNALYELLGSDLIHARLGALGYTDVRMPMRLGGCGKARKAAAVLGDPGGHPAWTSPAAATEKPQRFPYGRALKGRAWQQGARQVPGPHDFSASNFIALEDVQRIFLDLTGVAIPPRHFELSELSRRWLRDALATVPRRCPSPVYPEAQYPDNHGKYLLVGGTPRRLPPGIVIANKNALSYGYAGDCALITEPARKLAFALSAVVYVNRDGVLNDGAYEYAQIGLPFLRELGEALLAYERGIPAPEPIPQAA